MIDSMATLEAGERLARVRDSAWWIKRPRVDRPDMNPLGRCGGCWRGCDPLRMARQRRTLLTGSASTCCHPRSLPTSAAPSSVAVLLAANVGVACDATALKRSGARCLNAAFGDY